MEVVTHKNEEQIAHLNSFKASLIDNAGLIKNQIESIKNDIALIQEEADVEDKKQLERLAEALETLREHMEFTSQLFDSNEDIATLKQKFKGIGEAYTEVNSAEDINTVVLQYLLDYVNSTFLKKVATRVDGFFVQDDQGKKSYVKKEFNNSWIQILAFKTGLLIELYGNAVKGLKTSQEWQDVNKFVTFKKDLTREELHEDNKKIIGLIRLMNTIIKNRTEGVEKPDFSSKISLVREALSYKGQTEKLEVMSSLYMMNPNEHAFKVFHFSSQPIMIKINSWKLPSIGCDEYIYVPRLFPKITKEVIQKEYKENTINTFSSDLFESFEKPDLVSQKDQVLKELWNSDGDKVGIRINAPEHLPVFGSAVGNAFRKFKGLFSKDSTLDTEGIIIYIHGGGFASASTASYRPLTYRWANHLKMIQFSLEYRLSPTNKYPDALDDVWQAYLWILNYAETILGIKTNKIIIAGDSAGGNMALVLTLRLIRAGLRAPDGCFLIYPVLEISNDLINPSSLLAVDDTILPSKLLTLFNNAYLPEGAQPSLDPFISPVIASDDLLKKLPPVRLVFGDLDPLHDHSFEFMRRLVKLNKDVQGLVYEGAIHGFFTFTDNLKYNELTKDGLVMLRELIHPSNKSEITINK